MTAAGGLPLIDGASLPAAGGGGGGGGGGGDGGGGAGGGGVVVVGSTEESEPELKHPANAATAKPETNAVLAKILHFPCICSLLEPEGSAYREAKPVGYQTSVTVGELTVRLCSAVVSLAAPLS